MNTDHNNEENPMKNETILSFARRAIIDQRGQTLPFVALGMVALLGVGGLVVDVGQAYVVRSQLQSSANAAALAASGYVYTSSSASVNTTTIANLYGPGSGEENAYSGRTVTTTVTTKCLNSLMPKGQTCVSGSAPNAIQVHNSTTVNTFLMSLFHVPTLNVSATATASIQGVGNQWNVAIIIDSTGSMATVDTNCNSQTEFQCALSGTQAMLEATPPCPSGQTTCSEIGSNIRMSLFTFPNVLTSYNGTAVPSVSDDINCGGTPATWATHSAQPIAAPYTLPIPGAALTGAPDATSMQYTTTSAAAVANKTWTATYQITPFLSDYYDPSATGGLNSSSSLVKAVGYGSTKGCLTYTFGIDGTGSGSGFGNTYFAGAIYEAQAALAAEQAAQTAAGNPGTKNALIFVSDGQANASYYAGGSAYNSGDYGSTTQGTDANEFPQSPKGSEVGPNTTSNPTPAFYTPATSSDGFGYSTLGVNGKGLYPDWYDQCQQGIKAAQYATSESTKVFGVAYGSESQGCNSGWNIGLTDTTLVATGANASFTLSQLTPCVTMENIASSLNTFFSDYNQSGSGSTCQDASHPTVSLNDIFQAIAATFTTPRLIPNNAT
jgi:hypothetical protein